jgi:hypothetical protein
MEVLLLSHQVVPVSCLVVILMEVLFPVPWMVRRVGRLWMDRRVDRPLMDRRVDRPLMSRRVDRL